MTESNKIFHTIDIVFWNITQYFVTTSPENAKNLPYMYANKKRLKDTAKFITPWCKEHQRILNKESDVLNVTRKAMRSLFVKRVPIVYAPSVRKDFHVHDIGCATYLTYELEKCLEFDIISCPKTQEERLDRKKTSFGKLNKHTIDYSLQSSEITIQVPYATHGKQIVSFKRAWMASVLSNLCHECEMINRHHHYAELLSLCLPDGKSKIESETKNITLTIDEDVFEQAHVVYNDPRHKRQKNCQQSKILIDPCRDLDFEEITDIIKSKDNVTFLQAKVACKDLILIFRENNGEKRLQTIKFNWHLKNGIIDFS